MGSGKNLQLADIIVIEMDEVVENKGEEVREDIPSPPTMMRKSSAYHLASRYLKTAIRVAGKLLKDKNPNIRIAAAKLILAKTLPDLSAVAVKTSGDGQSLIVKFQLYGKHDPILKREIEARLAGVVTLEGSALDGDDKPISLPPGETVTPDSGTIGQEDKGKELISPGIDVAR